MTVADHPTLLPRRRVGRAVAAWAIGFGVLRTTLWAPEVCPPLGRDQAVEQAVEGGAWLAENQLDDARYLYEWDRTTATAADDYNEVRHAGVTMALYQLAGAGERSLLPAADRGLHWMLDQVEPTGADAAALVIGRANPKLGATALLVVSLVHRRIATGEKTHDDTMLDLTRFMVGQQRADGSMLNRFDIGRGEPVPEQTSIYSTGEALWALALMHDRFPDERFDEAAWKTLDYITVDRDRVEGFFPTPWPDQWTAYALAEMGPWGLEPHHVEYAEALLGRYGSILRFDAQRGTAYGSLTHGPAARGAGNGTWIEAMASLWRLTTVEPSLAHLEQPVRQTLVCGAANLADRQTVSSSDPLVDGAWFYRDSTRMDDQQHAASGLLLTAPAIEP